MKKDIENENIIHIAYACNDNYVLPLCCSIKSLLINSSKGVFYNIHIIHSEKNLSTYNKKLILKIKTGNCNVEFVNVDKEKFLNLPITSECSHITYETYYRYCLPSLLPDINKILYLDCDTIILKDISELYNYDIDDFYILGAADYKASELSKLVNIKKYFNAGVLLFNLKKIRNENKEEVLFKYNKENSDKMLFQDQDVINIVFNDAKKEVPIIYNYQIVENNDNNINIKDAVLLHFITYRKPWQPFYKSKIKKEYLKIQNKLPLKIRITKYYLPLISSIRKKIIKYKKSTKTIVFFDIINIKI